MDCEDPARKAVYEDCGGISSTCGSPEASGAIEAAAGQERAHSGRRRTGGGSCRVAVRVGEVGARIDFADPAYQPDKRHVTIRRWNAGGLTCRTGRFENTVQHT